MHALDCDIYMTVYHLLSSVQPIPDALNTLSEFMNRMERALSQNGGKPKPSGIVL